MLISIHANSVHDNGNGTFSFEVPVRELTSEESKVLETLFPHLEDAAHTLLEKEALLGALASHSEVMKPVQKYNEAVAVATLDDYGRTSIEKRSVKK